jgi:6-pyruvoyltetrahydropterin/6-carboxytetrahydropterin synthase
MKNNKVAVYRIESFNSAHRLHNPNWDSETNKRVFGKCNNPNFHGHNYMLEVKITGDIDPKTGYVIDTKILSHIIKEKVLEKFDHKNINLDVPEFKNINPTTENMTLVIHKILREALDTNLDLKIKLYETRKNFAEYPAS